MRHALGFCVAALVLVPALAQASSALDPAPLPVDGVIAGAIPAGKSEDSLYVAVDLKPGIVTARIALTGPASPKALDIALLDAKGQPRDGYSLSASAEPKAEATRDFAVDTGGRYLIRIVAKGAETTDFRLALGGTALVREAGTASPLPAGSATAAPLAPGLQPTAAPPPPGAQGAEASAAMPGAAVPAMPGAAAPPAGPEGPSQSVLTPTPVPPDGIIRGAFAPSEAATHYFYSVDLQSGRLLTQMSLAGRTGAQKRITLALLDERGRADRSYVMARSETNGDATRIFPIDRPGRYVLRVTVEGARSTRFKIEIGGEALASAR